MRVADRNDCSRGGNERGCSELLAQTSKIAGNPRDQPKERERAYSCDSGSFAFAPEREPPFDADQKPTGKSCNQRQRLRVGDCVQISRSECQRIWSAMKVEMK